MSDSMIQSGTVGRVTDRTAWSYVSGRISVLETLLLNRSFFENLLKSESLSEARSVIGKTQYRQLFTADEALAAYSHTLDTYSKMVIDRVFRDAPTHVLASFFDVSSRYRVFRTLFLRMCTRNAPVDELEKAFDTLTETPPESGALNEHRQLMKQREAPQHTDAVARSLFLDSAACTLMLFLAASAPEKTVKDLLHALAVLRTWSSVLRSRWNGTPADTVLRWFLVPVDYIPMVTAAAIHAESNPAEALAGLIPDSVFQKLRIAGTEILRHDIDSCIQDSVRDEIWSCRFVPYGPEKVMAFLVGFGIEQENLRLSFASIVHGIDRGVALKKLRKEYA